jgi:hypothetical protein
LSLLPDHGSYGGPEFSACVIAFQNRFSSLMFFRFLMIFSVRSISVHSGMAPWSLIVILRVGGFAVLDAFSIGLTSKNRVSAVRYKC